MACSVSYYELLGVEPNASAGEICAAFEDRVCRMKSNDRRSWFARTWGVDRAKLEEARDTLLDPVRRADHDANLEHTLPLCPPA